MYMLPYRRNMANIDHIILIEKETAASILGNTKTFHVSNLTNIGQLKPFLNKFFFQLVQVSESFLSHNQTVSLDAHNFIL